MTLPISQAAIDMIVGFEIGSPSDYVAHATWPGGASGPTIGIGYDLGYETRAQIQGDWGSHIAAADAQRLTWGAGIKGTAAQLAAARLKAIQIPLAAAEAVFYGGDVARYTDMTATAFQNCNLLSQDSLGALVSLVFNRGTDTRVAVPDSRLEMRQIAAAMASKNFAAIPGLIRAMKRLWEGQGLDGLLARRDAEAALFEVGLVSSVTPSVSPVADADTDPADLLMDQFNPGA